jgi:hypothetical protein
MSETMMTDSAANTSTSADASTASDSPTDVAQALYGEKQQQQADQQQDQSQTTDADSGDQEAPEGAPDKYEFVAPEGKEFDAEVITVFSEVAKELNLPQKAAQQILDKVAPAIEARQVEQVQALRQEWADTSKADKEFGGDRIAENLSVAKKALDQFGNPELRELLEMSGLGNHPEVIRFMFKAGQAISEDRYVGQSGGGKTPPKDFNSMASALYANQPN